MVMPTAKSGTLTEARASPGLAWSWTNTLATARPGNSYRVARIPASLSRESCATLGCVEGEVITCTGNRGGLLTFTRADGSEVAIERTLAWHIQAEPCADGCPRPK